MTRTDTATACNDSPSGGRGSRVSQLFCRADRCKREPQEIGGGTPKAKRCASWGGGQRKTPASCSAAQTQSGTTVVTVAVLTASQLPPPTDRAEGIRRPLTRSARRVRKASSLRRKVMSLTNLKRHQEGRVGEGTDAGDGLLGLILARSER